MLRGLESLRGIQSVEAFYHGTPTAMEARPVRDNSYDFGRTVLFKDVAAHDAYQIDPVHAVFNQDSRPPWSRVQVVRRELRQVFCHALLGREASRKFRTSPCAQKP